MNAPAPTPRCDKYERDAAIDAVNYGKTWNPIEFARILERELNTANALLGELQKLHGCGNDMLAYWCGHAAIRADEVGRLRHELKIKSDLERVLNECRVIDQQSAKRQAERQAERAEKAEAEVERLEKGLVNQDLLDERNSLLQRVEKAEAELVNERSALTRVRAWSRVSEETIRAVHIANINELGHAADDAIARIITKHYADSSAASEGPK